MAIAQSEQSQRLCPSCGHALREFAASGSGRRIRLDLCKRCQLMWFDKNELEVFPKAPKVQPAEMEQKLALAEVQFESNMEDHDKSAENIVTQVLEIIILIIRLFLFR
jgi:Zn-finger nucleic acid-binding protein